jgi:DNA-binding beta-propeller fold protein YncE
MSLVDRRHFIVLIVLATSAVLLMQASPGPAGAAPYTSDGITTSVTTSNSTPQPGETVTITIEASSRVARMVLVDIEVYGPDGSLQVHKAHDRVSLASTVQTFTVEWEVPRSALNGEYIVTVGVFDAESRLALHWNGIGASMMVGGAMLRSSATAQGDFEVWTTIQGRVPGSEAGDPGEGEHEIHILAPVNGRGDDMEVVDVIDYKELTAPGGQWEGTSLLNPHMVLFGLHGNPGSQYAYVSNVSSHNTSVIDASAREIVAVLNTGSGRTRRRRRRTDRVLSRWRSEHPNHCRDEDKYYDEQDLSPSQCGQIAEVLQDETTGEFYVDRKYNFSDFPEDSGWEGLPRFDPVCGSFTPDSRFFYVTNTSGGLVIFEINEDPNEPLFDVVRIYPAGTGHGQVAEFGCGVGYSTNGRLMFANSATANQSFYYIFNLRTNRLIRTVDVSHITSDLHGMMLSPRGDEVVMVGRLSDNFIVLNQRSGALKHNRTFDLDLGNNLFASSWAQRQSQIAETANHTIASQSSSAASSFYCGFDVPGEGPSTGLQPIFQQTVDLDPAPDLVDFSPDGKYIYVTLRGPNPATGTHAISGYPPGVVVIDFDTGETVQVIELPGDLNAQDPHGIAVRRMSGQ